jgi:hypothetical protein
VTREETIRRIQLEDEVARWAFPVAFDLMRVKDLGFAVSPDCDRFILAVLKLAEFIETTNVEKRAKGRALIEQILGDPTLTDEPPEPKT